MKSLWLDAASAEAALWQYNVLDVCIGTAEQVEAVIDAGLKLTPEIVITYEESESDALPAMPWLDNL